MQGQATPMLLWAFLPGTALATSVEAVPNPRDAGSWITDGAGVLDEAAEARIDAPRPA